MTGRMRSLAARAALLALAAALALPLGVSAEGEGTPTPIGGAVGGFGGWDWLDMSVRLGFVLLAIWAAVAGMRWYVRRTSGGRQGPNGRQLQLIETRALGPNRSLQLVRLGNRIVLLGVTADRINQLLAIEDPQEVAQLIAANEQGGRPPLGSGLLGGFNIGLRALVARTIALARPESVAGALERRVAARAEAAARTRASAASARPSRPAAATPPGTAAQRMQTTTGYGRAAKLVELQRAIAQARGEGQQ